MSDQDKSQSTTQNQSKVKIKVDGKEMEVTQDELVNLAQMGHDYTKKTQAVAAKEKELLAKEEELKPVKEIFDEMKTNPKLATAFQKTYNQVKTGKLSTEEATEANQKTLDKLIKQADDIGDNDTVSRLTSIRKIIADEGVADLIKDIAALKEEMNLLKSTTSLTREEVVESNLNKLSDAIGKDLVDKYRADLKKTAAKYPLLSIEKIFLNIATDEDAEKAIITKAKKRKETEETVKNNGSSAGGGSVTHKAEPARDSKGRIDWGKTLGNLRSSGRI